MENIAYDIPRFIKAQTNAMDTSKYIESQKLRKDLYLDELGRPTQNFYIEWIKKHAKKFREAWPSSCCKRCLKATTCKNCLKDTCKYFEIDPEILK